MKTVFFWIDEYFINQNSTEYWQYINKICNINRLNLNITKIEFKISTLHY